MDDFDYVLGPAISSSMTEKQVELLVRCIRGETGFTDIERKVLDDLAGMMDDALKDPAPKRNTDHYGFCL